MNLWGVVIISSVALIQSWRNAKGKQTQGKLEESQGKARVKLKGVNAKRSSKAKRVYVWLNEWMNECMQVRLSQVSRGMHMLLQYMHLHKPSIRHKIKLFAIFVAHIVV